MIARLHALAEGARQHALLALHALAGAQPIALGLALIAYLLGVVVIGARLRAAARALSVTLSLPRASAIGLSAVFASHVTVGAAAGEVARLGWLNRAAAGAPDAMRRALAIVAVDRVADGIAIGALILAGAIAGAPNRGLVLALVPVVLFAAALLVFAGLGCKTAPRQLAAGVARALPAALVAWALDLSRVYLVARAVGLPLGLTAICGLALAAMIGGHAPVPGGLGAVEVAMVATGLALDLPSGPLVAAVLVDRSLTYGLGTTLGALCAGQLVRLPLRRPA